MYIIFNGILCLAFLFFTHYARILYICFLLKVIIMRFNTIPAVNVGYYETVKFFMKPCSIILLYLNYNIIRGEKCTSYNLDSPDIIPSILIDSYLCLSNFMPYFTTITNSIARDLISLTYDTPISQG